MPALRVRRNLDVGEAAHLAADRLESLVEAGVADRALARFANQRGEGGAVLARVAGGDQGLDDSSPERRDLVGRKAEVGEAHDLALVHRDAAENLGEIFAQAHARHELFGLPEAAFLAHPPRVGRHFLDRFDIGRKPREAVGGVLIGLDPGGAELAVFAHPFAHGGQRAIHEPLGGELGLMGEVVERHGASLLQVGAIAAPQHASPLPPLQRVFLAPFGEKSRASGWRSQRRRVKMPQGGGTLEARVGAAFKIVWQAAEKFAADDGWAIASYIGLTLLTSLFPFLIFVAALAGFFFGSGELANEAAKLVFAEWPDVVARPIAQEVERVLTTPRSGGLLTFGAVFSFYFASSAIEALRVGLNRAYGLVEQRPWWLLRLQSLGLVLVGSIALLALAFLVVLGPLILDTLGAFFPAVAEAHELLTFLRLGIAALMLAASLILAHIILPAHRVGFLDILPGVALTFVASIAFGEAFGFYLSEYLRNYISTYAGLASVMIALVYLYWVALLFVFGGELNAARIRARRERQDAAATLSHP